MIIDRLYADVEKKGCICVGLDTFIDYIPEWFRNKYTSEEEALFEFNKRIIDATIDEAACFKVQIAYYESLGLKGLSAYKKTLDYIKSREAVVIADIKRGDISKTGEMYAKAHFEGDFEADFITLSPYMGFDSIEPYLTYIKDKNKGAFILMRTSNKGAKDLQYLKVGENKRVYDEVGNKVREISKNYMGLCNYSSIGAVVGCTHAEEGIEIRNRYKNMFFLIPGYGAQGGGAENVSIYLRNGNGGVINSSRGILLAYKKQEDGEKKFDEYARKEIQRMKEDITNAIKL